MSAVFPIDEEVLRRPQVDFGLTAAGDAMKQNSVKTGSFLNGEQRRKLVWTAEAGARQVAVKALPWPMRPKVAES